MAGLKTCALLVACLLCLANAAYGATCVNGTDACEEAAEDNRCVIGEDLYCCLGEQVIKATSTDSGVFMYCSCDDPSNSNTGHRCTTREDNPTDNGADFVTSASWLACALVSLLVLLVRE